MWSFVNVWHDVDVPTEYLARVHVLLKTPFTWPYSVPDFVESNHFSAIVVI